jgi:hypothetical protein
VTWHATLQGRADDLGRKLYGLRGRAASDRDLADLQARHADLCRQLRDLQARPQAPEPHAVDAPRVDFEGLAQSVERWIERQDAKAGR